MIFVTNENRNTKKIKVINALAIIIMTSNANRNIVINSFSIIALNVFSIEYRLTFCLWYNL